MSSQRTTEHESKQAPLAAVPASKRSTRSASAGIEVLLLMMLCFVYAGDPPPAVNEAHYLVKAKNFWDPSFCSEDLFASSGKAHTTFYWTFGYLTQLLSLEWTAWCGRFVGWLMLALGLRRCGRNLGLPPFGALVVAVFWLVGIEYGNLAGEWVVGGIEAKVPAYGFVLIGISEIIRRHWSRGWIWFGAASAFHVLTGGWAVIAGVFSFVVTERLRPTEGEPPVRFFSRGLFIGGLLSLFGLVPAINLTLGATPQESAEAAWIYSFVRIRHHLLPSDFPTVWFVRHAVVIGGMIAVYRFGVRDGKARRIFWIGSGAAAITCMGLLIGAAVELIPELAAKLLRYYWFRLSDAIVPLVLALMLSRLLLGSASAKVAKCSSALIFVVSLILLGWSIHGRIRVGVPPSNSHRLLGVHINAPPDVQRQSYRDWIAVCDWIRIATPQNEILLTPRHQQTFKWYSERAEVVNWKDVPQDAASLLEWKRRFDDVFPKGRGKVRFNSMRVPIGYSSLREYRRRYGVRFMVVDNRIATNNLPLVKIYPQGNQVNQTYSVYELPNN